MLAWLAESHASCTKDCEMAWIYWSDIALVLTAKQAINNICWA
jgi:hypothetical protein